MNWYTQSPSNWSVSEKNGNLCSVDISSSEALNITYDSVNTLINLLKDYSDIQDIKSGKLQKQLESDEQAQVSKCISDAIKCLNKLATDFNVLTPILFSPLALKTEEESSSFVSKPSSFATYPQYTEQINPYLQGNYFMPHVDDSNISIGSVFMTLDDAATVFEDYAQRCGFNTCKGNSKKDVYQEFSCSARGKVRVRKVSDESKQRNRKSIKKMCKCHIILRKKDNYWMITTRKLVHTHELLSSAEIKKTAKNRYIPEDCKQKAIELYEKGEPPAKIQLEFENSLQEKCTWSMKDLYNMLYKHKSR